MAEDEKAARRAQTKQWLEELREIRRPKGEKARVVIVPPARPQVVAPKVEEETSAFSNYIKLPRRQTERKVAQRAGRKTKGSGKP